MAQRSEADQPQASNGTKKADFGHIYNQHDPRQFFRELKPLEYQVPQHALPYVEAVLARIRSCNPEKLPKVLDICCSYGVNATLLRYEIEFPSLVQHFASAPPDIAAEKQIIADKHFLRALPTRLDIPIIGLDVAENAIQYALDTGLLTRGYAENLELQAPSSDLEAELRDVSLVVCTGGIGYVGTATFSKILEKIKELGKLWIVVFVLRIFPFHEIEGLLHSAGLITEKVPGVLFKQRRFASMEEQGSTVAAVRAMGLDPVGLEDEGWYYAECFVSRPEQLRELPLADLLKLACM